MSVKPSESFSALHLAGLQGGMNFARRTSTSSLLSVMTTTRSATQDVSRANFVPLTGSRLEAPLPSVCEQLHPQGGPQGGPPPPQQACRSSVASRRRSSVASRSSIVGRSSVRSTVHSGGGQSNGSSLDTELGVVFGLLQHLLQAHEVKLAMDFIEALLSSTLVHCELPSGHTQIAQEFRDFAQRQRDLPPSFFAATEWIEAAAMQVAEPPRHRPSTRGSKSARQSSKRTKPTSACERGAADPAGFDGLLPVVRAATTGSGSAPSSPRVAERKQQLQQQQFPPQEPALACEATSSSSTLFPPPLPPCSLLDDPTAGPLAAKGDPPDPGVNLEVDRTDSGQAPSEAEAQGIVHVSSSLSSAQLTATRQQEGAEEEPLALIHENDAPPQESFDDSFSGASSDHDVGTLQMVNETFDTEDCFVAEDMDLDDLSLEQINWLATPSDRWVISPNHRARVTWDLCALFVILFECVTLPLTMCFEATIPENVHNVSTIFFGVDILLNFATGYFHGSLLVMRRWWLTKRYLKTWCLLDFASTIPWEVFFTVAGISSGDEDTTGGSKGGGETTLLRIAKLGKLARVLRLLRLAKITSLLKRLQNTGLLPASLYELKLGMAVLRMFLIFGLLSHWAACVWGWVGNGDNFGLFTSERDLTMCSMGGPCEYGLIGSPWLQRYGLDNYDVTTQYLAALQFTAALMTGGEVSMQASTALERLFTILVMMCSIFISSVVVGQILLIMDRQSEASMAFDEQMQQSREFMVARRVPLNLQVELIDHLNRAHLCRHPFFKEATDRQAVRRICLAAEPMLFAAGDLVVEEGHLALTAHFLVKGKLKVMKAEGSVYMKPPSWIGDKCLFVETLRTNTVSAVVPTETLVVHKTSFQAVCSEFPAMQEVFDSFRETIVKDGWAMLRCPVCGDLGHSEACPTREVTQETSRKSSRPKLGRSRTLEKLRVFSGKSS